MFARLRLALWLLAHSRERRAAIAVATNLDSPWTAARRLASFLNDAERREAGLALLENDGFAVTFESHGLTWTSDVGRDGIARELVATGGYQLADVNRMIAWLAEHRSGCRWIIDVGANIGTTAVPFARAGYQVLALEPVPSTFEMLCRNVEANGLSHSIRCVQRAVSDRSGAVTMVLVGSSGQSELLGNGQGFTTQGYAGSATVDVPAAPLDGLLDEHGIAPADVALVWCDVQGAETQVIRTGSRLWSAGVPLFAEVWPAGLAAHDGVDAFLDAASVFSAADVDGVRCDLRAVVASLGGSSQADVLLYHTTVA